MTKKRITTTAYRASVAYVIAAGVWIFSSDVLLRVLRPHLDPIFVEETLRNLLFSGVAALVLFAWLEVSAARAHPDPGNRSGSIAQATSVALRMCAAIAVVSVIWAFGANALFYLVGANYGLMMLLAAVKDAFFVAITVPVVYFGVRQFVLASGRVAPGLAFGSRSAAEAQSTGGLRPRDPLWIPVQIFALLALSIGGTGYFLFDRYENSVRLEAEKSLTAIASLKYSQIKAWRGEHEKLAMALARDPFLGEEIRQWALQKYPADAHRSRIEGRLDSLRDTLGLQALLLLDADGNARLAAARAEGEARISVQQGRQMVEEALSTRGVVFSDIHHDDPDKLSDVVIELLVPLAGQDPRTVVGVLYGRIDPRKVLFPTIQNWPLPAVSGEALIVRREGEEVVFLNDLRHGPRAALQLRSPLAAERLIASIAARGKEGIIEGADYRGVASIAAAQRVADTPWILIAKIDADELYSPIHERARLVAVLSLLFIAGAGLATSLWWRQQSGRLLLLQYEEEIRSRALVRHFDYLTRFANDIILLFDEEWRIVEANERAVTSYGYIRDELLGMDVGRLDASHPKPSIDGSDARWEGDGIIYDSEHRRRDGSVFPVEISGRAIEVDGRKFRQAIVRDITERKAAEQRIAFLAHHDALTGLPNRVLMRDRLEQAILHAQRTERQVAVMMLDLDRFKNINDSLGHALGDLLLKSVGERLSACLRQSDTVSRPGEGGEASVTTVSRQGGDEFIVIASVVRRGEDAAHVASKILVSVSGNYDLEGHQVFITASIGISEFPGDGQDAETLIRNADVAMYHAKETGRNNFQFFSGGMTVRAQERLAMENSLRRGLERVEFMLHYQPQVDIRSGLLVGIEALVRWQHPELGLVPPGKFIPVAEDSGLMIELGEHILRVACDQGRRWQDAGMLRVPVAVNVSALQFHDRNFVGMVSAALRVSGLDASLLELELTEGVVMRHGVDTVRILEDLKGLGVMLAIDDFGTGYSSLSYLKRFPIDRLKIDQSFVRDIPADASDVEIVKAIIGLGHSLGLSLVAEGVETIEQYEFLQSQQCDTAQGYYISRPVPADEITKRYLARSPT